MIVIKLSKLVMLWLLLCLVSFSSVAKTYYNLNYWWDFQQLCTGSVSIGVGNPKIYSCSGKFETDDSDIWMNNGSTLKASGGIELVDTNINRNLGKVYLVGGTSGDTYIEDSSVYGDVSVEHKVTVKSSSVDGSISNSTNHEIIVEEGSWVSGHINAGTVVKVLNSQVNGDVENRTNNPIEIKDDSTIWGGVFSGTKVTVDDSFINKDVLNRTLNEIEVKNGSTIRGGINGGTKITIEDSEVTGDVSNRSNNEILITNGSRIRGSVVAEGQLSISDSEVLGNIDSTSHHINLDDDTVIHGNATAANNNWATIFFKDDDSVVYGECLYRTSPIDACSGTPPVNQNPQFEFGTLTDAECTFPQNGERTCTITFENTYDIAKPKPLVFVMPTIDASLSKLSLNQTELPSTASVISTTRISATIVQEVAPHRNAAIT